MRYILVIAVLLLAACDPVYLERQGNTFTPYRPAAAHYSARNGRLNSCSKDPQYCPAPPQSSPEATHLPTLVPSSSMVAEPSYD